MTSHCQKIVWWTLRACEDSHWRETLPLQFVWQGFHKKKSCKTLHHSHWGKTYHCGQCDKALILNLSSKFIWSLILGRYHISAIIVARILYIEIVFWDTWEWTLWRCYLNVTFVRRLIHIKKAFQVIWEYILGRSQYQCYDWW